MKRFTSIFRRFTLPECIGFILAIVCAFALSKKITVSLNEFWNKDAEFTILQDRAESAINDPAQLLATASSITIGSDDTISATFEENKIRVQAVYDKNLEILSIAKDYIPPMFYAVLVGIFFFILSTPFFIIFSILVIYLVTTLIEYLFSKIKVTLVR